MEKEEQISLWKRIQKIRKLSKEKEKENWEFRSYLKGGDIPSKKLIQLFYELYQKVSSEIDCRTCANCCREVEPVLDQKDIGRFSKCWAFLLLNSKTSIWSRTRNQKIVFHKKPCPFLKDNCVHITLVVLKIVNLIHIWIKVVSFLDWSTW